MSTPLPFHSHPLVAPILLAVGIAGCSSVPDSNPVIQHETQQGNWFCEMAENQDDWACIQSEELAKHPKPTRTPAPLSQASEKSNDLPPKTPLEEALDTQVKLQRMQQEKASTENAEEKTQHRDQAPATQPSARTNLNKPDDLPDYQRLAYQPDHPMRLIDLPADYYAVQIVALSSKQALESYVKDRNLIGMSAARIEREGKLYYVLLLGIYQDRETAELAAADRPEPLKDIEPWIRRLGSLQASMLRANKIAGSSEV